MSTSRDVVVVSNRGPLSFARSDDGTVQPRRGGGGLITAIGPGVEASNATWVAAAITDEDRQAAGAGLVEAHGFRLHLLTVDTDDYRSYYDGISNSTLWYLYHGMFNRPRQPTFGDEFREQWAAYRRVNAAYAEAVAATAPTGATVLVHDYHLSLVGQTLAEMRPDLATAHFTHVPFCGPDDIALLPDDIATELMTGLTAYGACGFHTTRWAEAFAASCEAVLGRLPNTFVAPAAADQDDIAGVATGDACSTAHAQLDAALGDRRFLVRVDRIELSKNLLRGFEAFDALLERHPKWRGNLVFGAFIYPSRSGLVDYQEYAADTEALVRTLNEKWGTDDWTPIMLNASDDFPLSVAALRRADAVLVNPIRDGLNLVAKEAAIVNERDAGLVLSRQSGAWDELSADAFGINPYDIGATATAMHEALTGTPDSRRSRAVALRAAATSRSPLDWFNDQVAAAR